jgi:hypothetical protein
LTNPDRSDDQGAIHVPNIVTRWQNRDENGRNCWSDRAPNRFYREQPSSCQPQFECNTGNEANGGHPDQGLIPEEGRAYNYSQGKTWNEGNGYSGQTTQRRFGNGMGTTGSQYASVNTFPGVQQTQPNTYGGYAGGGLGGNYVGGSSPAFGYGGYPNLGRETYTSYNLNTPIGEQNQWSRSFTDGVRSASQWASNGFQQVMNGWSNSPVASGLGGMFGGGGWGSGGSSFGGVSNLSAMPYGGNSLGFSGSSMMGGGGFRFI